VAIRQNTQQDPPPDPPVAIRQNPQQDPPPDPPVAIRQGPQQLTTTTGGLRLCGLPEGQSFKELQDALMTKMDDEKAIHDAFALHQKAAKKAERDEEKKTNAFVNKVCPPFPSLYLYQLL
jgi:hypothetical protein